MNQTCFRSTKLNVCVDSLCRNFHWAGLWVRSRNLESMMLRNHGEHTDWPRMRRVSQLGKLCSPKDVATKEHAKFEVECQPPCCGICRVDNLRRLPATGLRQKVQAPVAAEGAGNVSPGGCVTQWDDGASVGHRHLSCYLACVMIHRQ